ncbi:glycosyl hydrolase family 28-related protein [Morganella morganii]|uniref:tail fiber/spike domain-containing protein n=1 Tax=Morganella morganii TaxID=582 RepID=UPI0034E5645D
MATIPTQNAVPSEAPRDLKFNSGKIDEFVTSLEHEYKDRFGRCHMTIEGMRWIFEQLMERFKVDINQAIIAAGYIPIDSFQQGAEITKRNEILRDETTGEYYRWDGDLPKSVPAGSTPESAGGVGVGAWVGVGDASLRSEIKSTSGLSIIGDANYDDIRLFSGVGDVILCRGRDIISDGGEGVFYLDVNDVVTDDNDGTVIIDSKGRRWKRNYSGAMKSEWFGVVGDNSIIDNKMKNVYKALAGGGEFIFCAGSHLVSDSIKIYPDTVLRGAGRGKTKIIADASMHTKKDIFVTSNYTGEEHDNVIENIIISDLSIDGNAWSRGEIDWEAESGCGVHISAAKNVKLERVDVINSVYHGFDISSSTYYRADEDYQKYAKGMSDNVALVDCSVNTVWIDDGFTTHNSKNIKFIRCRSVYTRSEDKTPSSNQVGFEIDDGSINVSLEDCYSEGWCYGYQAKGHTNRLPALNTSFTRCISNNNATGFHHYYDNTSGSDTVMNGVSMINCQVSKTHKITASDGKLIPPIVVGVDGVSNFSCEGLKVTDAGEDSRIAIRSFGGEGWNGNRRISFIGVDWSGTVAKTDELMDTSLIHVFNNQRYMDVNISGVMIHNAQYSPVISAMVDSSNRVSISDIYCGNHTGGMDHCVVYAMPSSPSTTVSGISVSGTGWVSEIYDGNKSRSITKGINFSCYGGLCSGSAWNTNPEGAINAPMATRFTNLANGDVYIKITDTEKSSGWVKIN